jgi:predicted nucleotidyltransferase
MATAAIENSRDDLRDFCLRWKISELGVFGSTARGEQRADSDIDVLVTFAPGASWGLFDLVRMEDELATILQHPVDLVERSAVEDSPNYIRRRSILESVVPLYAEP